jgi:hypothetical protein
MEDGEYEFTVKGKRIVGSKKSVEEKMKGVEPEPTRSLVVEVNGRLYPVKQVLAQVFEVDRADFISHQARSVMRRLGFTVKRLV